MCYRCVTSLTTGRSRISNSPHGTVLFQNHAEFISYNLASTLNFIYLNKIRNIKGIVRLWVLVQKQFPCVGCEDSFMDVESHSLSPAKWEGQSRDGRRRRRSPCFHSNLRIMLSRVDCGLLFRIRWSSLVQGIWSLPEMERGMKDKVEFHSNFSKFTFVT